MQSYYLITTRAASKVVKNPEIFIWGRANELFLIKLTELSTHISYY